MTVITKVSFSHPDMALADTITSLPDADVQIMPEAGTDPEHNTYFILAEGVASEEFESVLASDHTVEDVRPMSEYDEQHVYGVVFKNDVKLIAPKVTEMGGLSLEARSGQDNWVERWQLPDRQSLTAIWEYARAESFQFDVLELYEVNDRKFDRSFGLTEEQREALMVAYRAGYFEEPREMSLVELADELGISPAAASGRLRRGLTKLVGTTIVEHD